MKTIYIILQLHKTNHYMTVKGGVHLQFTIKEKSVTKSSDKNYINIERSNYCMCVCIYVFVCEMLCMGPPPLIRP